MKRCSTTLIIQFSSIQSLGRAQLCDPVDCSMLRLLVHQQLPEFTQTHVHGVSDAIQPSSPLSSPSPSTFNLSQHQSVSQFSHSVMPDSLWPYEPQHARPHCPSPTPRVCPNSGPLSQWCHQPSHPLLSTSPPAFNLSQHQGLYKWVNSSHQVAKILEFQLQHQSFQWTPRTDFF